MAHVTLYAPAELRRLIGGKARSLRLDRRYTQADLAAAAGVSLSTITRFERGEDVSFNVVISVAFALGVETSLLDAFPISETRSFDELTAEHRPVQRIRKRSST